jgi:hypothetical protein
LHRNAYNAALAGHRAVTIVDVRTSIIDHRIDSLRMRFLQNISEVPYTLLLTDVERVELDRGMSSIFCQDASLLKRFVGVQCLDGLGAAGRRAGGQVDGKGS